MYETDYQAKARVLLIHLESALRTALGHCLEQAGYHVHHCNTLAAALQSLQEHAAHLLILVQNPGTALEQNLQHLRSASDLPLLLFSADTSDAMRLRALRCGADDCVSLAVEPKELTLRVDAMLRRNNPGQRLKKQRRDVLNFDDLTLHKKQRSAKLFGQPLDLTPLQFNLLWCLLSKRGHAIKRRQLYREGLEKQLSAYDRSLDMHIVRLRKKLQAVGLPADCISTVHGEGYKFLEEEHFVPDHFVSE